MSPLPIEPVPPAPGAGTCSDGIINQDESDRDCGGRCGATCQGGSKCRTLQDCAASLDCPAATLRCAAPSCTDGERNGGESAVDCGGSCRGCATAEACQAGADCQSGVCAARGCASDVARCCQAPSCGDGVLNGSEVDVDCGASCGLCPLAASCNQSDQCQSGLCQANRCTDPGSCSDGVRNGTETSLDCGGDSCPRCADQLACTQASDCSNNDCFNGVCVSCGSGVLDGTETDIDCGGSDPFCRRCNPGERCLIGSDCLSGSCLMGFCG
jgi:hypothetical protein